MKKILLLFSAIASFHSCSSDDDTSPRINKGDITGSWKEVAYKNMETGAWQEYTCEDNVMYLLRYTFNTNGTVYNSPYCEGQEGEFVGSGTYSVKGDILTITANDGPYIYQISREGETTLYMRSFYTANGQNVYTSNTRLIKE